MSEAAKADPTHGAAPRSPARCPLCGKPADAHYRPFCSKRCADIDLARWLRGDYRIPGEPVSSETDPADPGFDG